ncbi:MULTISPECIES: formate/nitrite transporter family protein [unclassified Streptococcus]|uniref:formate/nitrite transporter family protein n=1 Tax=unclassified Streptococcus TaxID=2608887 RepID=UPI001FFCADBF|nr:MULTISPECIES: formate/nitrite transporter family protein [unclassified Streptococcus]
MAAENSLMSILKKGILKKEDLYDTSYWAYALRSILASVYLAVGIAISMFTADKMNQFVPGLGRFGYGLLFGWGLLILLYMNTELGTSNMMYMTVATHRKLLTPKKALKILATCIGFNFIGAIIVAFLLSQTSPFLMESRFLVEGTVAKLAKSPWVLFMDGVFANIIVNISVFCYLRMKDDAGKLISVAFIMYIFAFFGFEHVIANFSIFFLSIFTTGGAVEGMTLTSVLMNFLMSGLGNFVGGGLVIGLLYSWLNEQSDLYVD